MTGAYRFGPFELDPRTSELRRAGAVLPLQPQPAGILALLVSRAGELVTREEIQAAIWPDRVVDYEQGLNYAVRQIRAALGDDAESPRYVETLPRRGYRFVAPVELLSEEPRTDRRVSRRAAAYALAALLLAAGTVAAVAGLDRDAPAPVERPTVAVLPFDNVGPDPGDLTLARGLTEQIITDLAQIDPQHLAVIARTSSARFAASDRPLERIGEELGADFVVEGSVLRAGGTVRVTTQLLRVSDRTHVWAETWDRPVADVLTLQAEIGQRVAEAVAPGLALARPDEESPLPADPVAREAFLVARGLLNTRDPAVLTQARQGFEKVLATAPDHAQSLVGLGEARLRSGDPAGARAPLERALELNPEGAQAHHLLAQVLLFHDWEWETARRHLVEAHRLRPGQASVHQVLAYWQILNGRMEEARRSIGTALWLDPLSSYVQADAGWIDYWAGDLNAAESRCGRTVELDPKSGSGRTCLLFVRIARGDLAAARAAAQALMASHEATPADLATLDDAPAAGGLKPYWSWEAQRLEALPERSPDDAFLLALANAQLGRNDDAFHELHAAREGRTTWMLWLEVEPLLEPLRDDPRWPDLVRSMGFPPG